MCSIGEDDFGDDGGLHAMTPTTDQSHQLTTDLGICKKCNTVPAIVKLDVKEAQCTECFLAYIRHKFRATLGSTKLVARGARVLIVYDGAAASTTLLHMIDFAMEQNQFKRLHIEPILIYIDENCMLQNNAKQYRIDKFVEIKSLLAPYPNIPMYYSSIGNSSSLLAQAINTIEMDERIINADLGFLKKLSELKTLTSRQDYVHCMRNNQIRSAAQKLNCKYAFISEIVSDLATKLLANIALGRGAAVAQDVSVCDARSDVQIIRPIRDFSQLEVDYYLKLTNTKFLNDATKTSPEQSEIFSSVQNLTRNFIEELQVNFPATVSTVFRTGNKISTAYENSLKYNKQPINNEGENVCTICASTLDLTNSSTLRAIEFSKYASINTAGKNDVDPPSKDNGNMCHGCQNIYNDLLTEDKLL